LSCQLPRLDQHGRSFQLDVAVEPPPEVGVVLGPAHALLLQVFPGGRHEVAVDRGHLLPRADGREVAVSSNLRGGESYLRGR
jgi:hypothetical protein